MNREAAAAATAAASEPNSEKAGHEREIDGQATNKKICLLLLLLPQVSSKEAR